LDNEIASVLSLGTLQLSRGVQGVTATARVLSRLLQGSLSSARTGLWWWWGTLRHWT